MSESSNYFCYRMAFDRFDTLLRPGGHILLSAIFKRDGVQDYATTHAYSDYMAHALRQYRSGERKNAIMAGFATNLSDADIEDLAAWFASLDGLATAVHKK